MLRLFAPVLNVPPGDNFVKIKDDTWEKKWQIKHTCAALGVAAPEKICNGNRIDEKGLLSYLTSYDKESYVLLAGLPTYKWTPQDYVSVTNKSNTVAGLREIENVVEGWKLIKFAWVAAGVLPVIRPKDSVDCLSNLVKSEPYEHKLAVTAILVFKQINLMSVVEGDV